MEPQVAALRDEWRQRARAALEQVALELLAEASADAPYDPAPDEEEDRRPGHHLRDSGHLEFRETRGAVIVEVVFDGPYAAVQHERIDYKHPHGGRAKYLEANLNGPRMLERLAQAERELLR